MDASAGLAETVREYHRVIDEAIKGALAELGKKGKGISCVKGCAWCCHLPVRATLPEGALAALYIRENFKRAEVDALVERTKGWLEWNEGRVGDRWAASARDRFTGPGCPFLKDNLCMIYPVRPMGCRVHSSTADPSICGPDISPHPSPSPTLGGGIKGGGSYAWRAPLFSTPGTVPEILDAVKPICMDYRKRLEEMGLHFEGMVKLLPEAVLQYL